MKKRYSTAVCHQCTHGKEIHVPIDKAMLCILRKGEGQALNPEVFQWLADVTYIPLPYTECQ